MTARSAHHNVGELAAAAVVEAVGYINGGTLGAMDGRCVPMVEAVGTQVVAPEQLGAAIIHAGP